MKQIVGGLNGRFFDMLKDRNINYRIAGENILNPDFNKTGIGIYSGDKIYWTQTFTNLKYSKIIT